MDNFSREVHTTRVFEWEKAKGAIRGLLSTIWEADDDEFIALRDKAEKFLEEFGEEAGLD